jgi:hypothetical protein
MKVYIVTDGDYSDYMIEKVFSNRKAAEEYKYWHHIKNEIEEYEVADTAMDTDKRYMFIRVSGIIFSEAVVDIKYDIHPATIPDTHNKRWVGFYDYNKHGSFTLYTDRYIPAEHWDEEKYKAKFLKVLYDLAAMAKAMFAEGASVRDVEQALRNKDEEEV